VSREMGPENKRRVWTLNAVIMISYMKAGKICGGWTK
jgi:hypothetical protein